ncbi:MAG: deoxyguanosinetriphosphate triphosphohydrolase [Acidimicrobiia bacterium]|nr:deoxyguanosinetriphosphate triphosphohydrolase [Acidimicrobiia bacterium]NNK91465.1 deoxyguanosinetriphosphate triphosphohydrolase [Acidimicrobiia bacterium]
MRERLEDEMLAPEATRAGAATRSEPEEPDPFRTAFERDRDRIVHSKAFRRLKHKTQVFMMPEGDHFVTRLTHTLQVTQIGRAIARALGLNEELTEAICLGHDVGHSPFGHTGEEALSEFVEGGWRHSDQSVRIFEVLEPLNLTAQVTDGIRAHPWRVEKGPSTHEGGIVRFADRIAYLAHDVEDAVRADMLRPDDLPADALVAFGDPGKQWIDSMVTAVIDHSLATGEVSMDPATLGVMHNLRAFMFERVYLAPSMEPERRRAKEVVRDLVAHFMNHLGDVPETYRHDDADQLTQVVDYVSGMTDRFAVAAHDRIFRPALF